MSHPPTSPRQGVVYRPTAMPTALPRRPGGAELFAELEESEAAANESSWTVGYLDLLLLLLTLFAILLAVTYMQVSKTQGQVSQALELAVPLPTPPARLELDPRMLLAALQSRPVTSAPMTQPPASAAIVAPSPASPVPIPPQASAPVAPAPLVIPPPLALERLARLLAEQVGNLLELSVGEGELRLELRNDILFPLGSADLGPQGRALLDQLVGLLRAAPETILSVEGHTDDRPIATPRFPSNWELSSFRATSVARYLIERGIPAERLRATGHADTRPRVANDTPDNRSRNRRVSILLYLDSGKAVSTPLAGPGWRDL